MLRSIGQPRTMRLFLPMLAALAIVLQPAGTPAARAEIVTFANYAQDNPGNPWVFTSGSFPGTATFSANLAVQFQWLADLSGTGTLPIGVSQLATLTLSATTTAAAQQIPVGPLLLDVQPFNGPMNVLSIRRASDNANLLTTVFLGDLAGIHNTSVGSLRASTQAPNGLVLFTSDFVDFSETNERAMSLSFSSIQPLLGLNGASGQSFLRSFSAAGTGTFDSEVPPVIPEPASLTLLGIGTLGLLGYGWRRRKAKA